MKGTVSIISAGDPTLGVEESGIKTVVGAGVKKGIDAFHDDKKQLQNKSKKQSPSGKKQN